MSEETHNVVQYTRDGRRVATMSGLGRHRGTMDAGHTRRSAQYHAKMLRRADPAHNYRAEPINGPAVADYALEHIRADGPVSFGSVRAWLLDQHPDVNAANATERTVSALTELTGAGLIESEPHGESVVYWSKGK